MLPIIAALGKIGLPLLARVVAKKGTEFIKEKIGIDIAAALDSGGIPDEMAVELRRYEMEHEEELQKIALEGKKVEADVTITSTKEATKRAEADMSGTSWLPKNVRPVVLIALTAATIWAALDSSVSVQKLAALTSLDALVYGYYFIGRSGEKGMFSGIAAAFKRGK